MLTVDRISKSFEDEVLFKDLSFTVGRGECVALCGTDVATAALMQVLAGEDKPDSGEIIWGPKVNLAYFPREHGHFFESELNIVDWLRQFSDNAEEEFVRSFLGRMLFKGHDTQKPTNVLSGGERVRCMLARMMLQDPNFLLLDGPTAHLDLESITALNDGLLEFEGSMIVCSHDVQFVHSLVDRVIELHGEEVFDMNVSSYEEYLEDEERQARAKARQR